MPLCWAVTGTTYIRQLPRYTEKREKLRAHDDDDDDDDDLTLAHFPGV